jgi:glycerol-3-phosphate acyltransferase PlsX
MGGDFAPEATVSGAILAYNELPAETKIVLIGDEKIILSELNKHHADAKNFVIVHAPEVIAYNEHPTKAISQKPNSSIAVGFRLLKEEQIDGFASNGNTGAMLVGSMFSVKTISGIIRPCISTAMPKVNGGVGILLDVGINADCKPDVLYQFAVLGSIYAENVYGVKNPKVGLLNIGEEAEKGNLISQAAYTLMNGSKDFNFIGNIEGRDLYNDKADVIVCEGFTGNVALKQAEEFYWMVKHAGIQNDYFDRFNYEIYGGTPVLGINSTVMIGHGISNAIAVKNMIIQTGIVAEAKLSDKIKQVFQ